MRDYYSPSEGERATAIETLALRLFQKMEHLDPTEDLNLDAEDWGWSELTQLQRDFYLTCIRTILCDPRSLLIALGQTEEGHRESGFIDGQRYLIAIPWWRDDVWATFRNGKFVLDGLEDEPDRHFPPHLVTVIEQATDPP